MTRKSLAQLEGEKFEKIVQGARKPATKREAAKAEHVRELRNVAHHHSENFTAAVAAFKEAYPDKWENLRLCPLQHGVTEIAELLK